MTDASPYNTKEKVHNRAKDVIGIPVGEIYKENNIEITEKLTKSKNFIGDAFELWMKVPKNSRAEADIPEAGVELKATPYKLLKSGKKSAKERLVLNIINYMDEANKNFETSSFKHKDKLMELIFYCHNNDIPKEEWTFDEAIQFSFPEKDLKIIKNDWNKIHQKIVEGHAEELSEGLTDYLAACTKGSSSKSIRQQPFSDVPAKQRAYSLKASYMTQIIRNYVFGDQTDPAIKKEKFSNTTNLKKTFQNAEEIVSSAELDNKSLDTIILEKLNKYKKLSVQKLAQKFNLKDKLKAKNINAMLVARMLGLKGNTAENAEEIKKSNIQIKTIRINKNNTIKENMSFRPFKFKEIISQNFEDSDLYSDITNKFLFVIFKENENKQYIFEGARFWYMPNSDLEIVKQVWIETKNTIKNGVKLALKNGRVTNNFIKKADERIIHVRPHSRKSSYKKSKYSNKLPTPIQWISTVPNEDSRFDKNFEYMTTQSFWLNNSYVLSQLKKMANINETS